jgi:hypothetical protein
LIRLSVTAPGRRPDEPMWLWASAPDPGDAALRALWQAYLRRFDIEKSKPQCCHSRGWLALSSVPSCSVFMRAA